MTNVKLSISDRPSPEALSAAEPELQRFAFLVLISNTIGRKETLPGAEKAIEDAGNDRALGLYLWIRRIVEWNESNADPTLSQLLPLARNALARANGELAEPDIELCIRAAHQHGMDDDPDHEAGDLQDSLRDMWRLLTPGQRSAFMASESVLGRLEMGLCNNEFELHFPEHATT